jgi:hypothetical protein
MEQAVIDRGTHGDDDDDAGREYSIAVVDEAAQYPTLCPCFEICVCEPIF